MQLHGNNLSKNNHKIFLSAVTNTVKLKPLFPLSYLAKFPNTYEQTTKTINNNCNKINTDRQTKDLQLNKSRVRTNY